MLNSKTFFVLISFVFSAQMLNAQKLELNGSWKYNFKDAAIFSADTVNDIEWKEGNANHLLFKGDEFDYQGQYTELRKTIIIP